MGDLDFLLSSLLPVSIFVHLILAPYTKVEESFNIQAIHDIVNYGLPGLRNGTHIDTYYDHVEFPGSVPRTFVGALFLAGLSSPFMRWMNSPQQRQVLVRGLLALLNAEVLTALQRAVRLAFGRTTSNWYILLQVTQFHVIYYASRTLPNMYAFTLTTLALRSYLMAISSPNDQKHHRISLFLLTVAGVVFRSELAVLVFTQTIYLLASNQASLTKTIIPAGALGAIVGLLITVPIDSFFWQEFPLWPEWTSFYYNTILGKSSDWGISPWHFYFSNALPRLLTNPLTYTVLMPLATLSEATKQRVIAILVPQLGFIGLYSLLPHKEWRFVLYVIPALTTVSAIGAAWIWNRRTKSLFYRLLSFALIGSIVSSFAVSSTILAISRMNYPGGEAMIRLHELAKNDVGRIRVFADNLACQTGVTRFLEARQEQVDGQPRWNFDKTENQTELLNPIFWDQFDYILTETPERVIGNSVILDVVTAFEEVQVIRPGHSIGPDANSPDSILLEGRTGLLQSWNDLGEVVRRTLTRGWWVTLKLSPKIKILKRQPHSHP